MSTRLVVLLALMAAGCASPDDAKPTGTDPTTGEPTTPTTGSTSSGTPTGTTTGTATGSTTDPDMDGDGVPASLDCDDADPDRFPGNAEQCDDIDHDCDTAPRNGLTMEPWFMDADGDGYGDVTTAVFTCDGAPADHVADSTDCDDGDALVNPGAAEICDGADQNCDLQIDDGLTHEASAPDLDGDGWGDGAATVYTCDGPPAGYVTQIGDCDDGLSGVNYGAAELCDDLDNNCDGYVDEGLQVPWYADTDGDDYGDAASSVLSCPQPIGFVADDTDCDDGAATTYPGAPELCDGVDNDCSMVIDDGAGDSWYTDNDGDGFAGGTPTISCSQPAGTTADGSDCDDTNPLVYPGATPVPCDLVDSDCSGTDEEWVVPRDGTLQAVHDLASAGDLVCIAEDVTAGATLSKDLVLQGVANPVLSDSANTPVAIVGGLVTVRDLEITGTSTTTLQGGGVYVASPGAATLENVVVRDSLAQDQGGGVYVGDGARFTMIGGALADNYVSATTSTLNQRTGGGLYAGAAAVVLLDDVDVVDNWVVGASGDSTRGGGLGLFGAVVTLADVRVYNNIAAGPGSTYGGGIWTSTQAVLDGRRLDVRGNTSEGNIARGAGLYFYQSEADLRSLIVAGNLLHGQTQAEGAAHYDLASTVDVRFATVLANEITSMFSSGGGIWTTNQSTPVFEHAILQDNQATGSTAAFWGPGTATWTLTSNNTPSDWSSTPTGPGIQTGAATFITYFGFPVDLWDLHPAVGSPAIDAGDPTVFDLDSTTADIGAYGGPDASW